MLAQDSIMVGVSGTGEESSEGFRALLSQIEAELYRSEVYRRALESLEASEGTSAQFCLKSVGREAIRLALWEMMPAIAPEPADHKTAIPEPDSARQDCLQRLGAQIRTARQVRSMSIVQLHSKTLVPVHQLQAIEAGYGTHLPEDVYLRGFIQRIAKALNLDSVQLLDLLPAVDPIKAVLPTWYHPPRKRSVDIGGMSLQPVHLYLGYAALLSGGFVWLSHQTAPPATPRAIELSQPVSKSQAQPATTSSTGIAAPERVPERV